MILGLFHGSDPRLSRHKFLTCSLFFNLEEALVLRGVLSTILGRLIFFVLELTTDSSSCLSGVSRT
jgi:hypothetical protein